MVESPQLVLILLVAAIVTNVLAAAGYAQTPNTDAAPTAASTKTVPAEAADHPRVARWSESLLWIAVLLLVLLVSAGAIIVFSRRFKAFLLAGHRKPTPSEDVWTMHRLPPDAETDRGIEPDYGNGDFGHGNAPFGPDETPPDEPSIG